MMAGISQARQRFRLITDRSDSPWLTNAEVDGFIELALNEYVRERVNSYGANQEIVDDLGTFVRTVNFAHPLYDENNNMYLPSGVYSLAPNFVFANEIIRYSNSVISPAAFQGAGIFQSAGDSIQGIFRIGTVLSISIVTNLGPEAGKLKTVKILSIDKFTATREDPFNNPGTDRYTAAFSDGFYWIRPEVENVFNITDADGNIIETENKQVILTYIDDVVSPNDIIKLPLHGREEVCLIASRKILGATADETYQVGASEIQQLKGK